MQQTPVGAGFKTAPTESASFGNTHAETELAIIE